MKWTPRGLFWALFFLAIAILSWQWRVRGQTAAVETAKARSLPLIADWSAVGYVESRTAQVSAPQIGRIVEITVQEGDRVRAGQILARLTRGSEEAGLSAQEEGVRLARAQADSAGAALTEGRRLQSDHVRRAEAELSAAEERYRQSVAALSRDRMVTRAGLDSARSAAQTARAELADLQQGSRPEEIAQAEAELSAAEATALRARTEAARQAQLLDEGAVARSAVEDAQEARARTEAVVRERKAALKLRRNGPRPEQIAAARSRVRTADAQVAVAEGEVSGLAVSARKVDENAAALRASRAALAEARSGAAHIDTLYYETQAAQARIRQSRASSRQARETVFERTVRAPFDGVVGRRTLDPGDIATPSQPLLSIVESDHPWVTAEVDEQDMAPVHEGQRVTITIPAYAGREFPGIVGSIGGEAIPQTEVRTGARIIRVRVDLHGMPPADRALFKPGMEVEIAGRKTLRTTAIQIPSDAILTDSQGAFVWTVENGQVRRRRVRAGFASGRETEILDGLQEGEQVVVSGKEGLQDGVSVNVRGKP